jgi:ketosteroid isomerase-like protein
MSLRRLSIACALLLHTACASGVDPATRVESLLETDAEFARYSREHGAADAFERFLSDDAIELPTDVDVVTGRPAIVERLRALDDGWVLDWAPVHAEASTDGSLGFTWGRWVLYRAATPGSRSTGKYLTVWRRGPDGRWRVAADIGNQAPAVPD